MASPAFPLYSFAAKTNVQIRSDILRVVKNGLIAQGVTNPNIGPNSDYYLWATALGNEIAVPQANAVILADQLMPDTAAAAFLDRWLALVNLKRNGATNSFGNITLTISSSSTLVVTGQQLTDNIGLRYQVTVGGTYTNGAQIPVQSIDLGAATDHANGDTLTWVSAPAFASQNVTVGLPGGTDGLEGGADSEVGVDEPPRARLFAVFQDPPKGGNASDLIGWAGQSSSDVQAAFAYPALLGPSTAFFLVAGQPQTSQPLSSTSKNRDLPTPFVTGTVLPFVLGLMPEHSLCVGASVTNLPIDVAILLSLPAAPTASPAGPGGGWVDGSPWPASVGGLPCVVTAVATSSQITLNAATAPSPGVTHIAWFSPFTWQLYTAVVTSIIGGSGPGAYQITLDTPFPGIAVNNAVMPLAANTSVYLQALLDAFSTMGPGEWLAPGSQLLSRAFRHPIPSLTWPSAMGAQQLKEIINSGNEVLDASYIFTGTASTSTSFSAPTPPAVIAVDPTSGFLTSTAPSVLTPANLSFYAQ